MKLIDRILFIFVSNWIQSWIALLCELINIITLCYYRPWWDYNYMTSIFKYRLKSRSEDE